MGLEQKDVKYSTVSGQKVALPQHEDADGTLKITGKNNPLPVEGVMQLLGSNVYEAHEVIAYEVGTHIDEKTLTLSNPTKDITVINDGVTDAKIAFDKSVIEKVDQTNSKFVYSGTWTQTTLPNVYGGNTKKNTGTTVGESVILKPDSQVKEVGFLFWVGKYAGIANIFISSDGTTWKKPSEISGITRNDGVTGTAMDSVDGYVNSSGQGQVIMFKLPNAATWSIKVETTNTKHASSLGYEVHVDGGFYELSGAAIPLKAGETFNRSLNVTTINYRAVQGAPSLRIIGES